MKVPGHNDWRSRLKNFFLFCSGAEMKILVGKEECHIEHNRYIGIGASVLFTALFAFATFSYAMHMIFGNVWMAMLVGLLWGLFIFNLDRLIINSSKSSMLIRIPVAILLALSITVPFELKIFESEIKHELSLMGQEILQEQEAAITARYDYQITENQEKIDGYKAEIAEKEARYDELIQAANLEGDGSGGSGNRGLGPVYEAKKRTADAAFADLNETKSRLQPQVDSLMAYKTTLITERDQSIQNERATFSYDGFVPRLKAFHMIRHEDEVFWASIMITLLFLAVELAPILVKMMFKDGSYEALKEQLILEKVAPVIKSNHATRLNNSYEQHTISEAFRYQIEADNKRRSSHMEAYTLQQNEKVNKLRSSYKTSWWSALFPNRQEELVFEGENYAQELMTIPQRRKHLEELKGLIPQESIPFNSSQSTKFFTQEPEEAVLADETEAEVLQEDRSKIFFSNEQELFAAKGKWLIQMDESQGVRIKQATGKIDAFRVETDGSVQRNWQLYGEGEVILTDRRILLYQPQFGTQKIRQIRIKEIDKIDGQGPNNIVIRKKKGKVFKVVVSRDIFKFTNELLKLIN